MTLPEQPTAAIHRVAFLGTPALAVVTLRRLVERGTDVAVVVTAPPKRRGRGSALVSTPVEVAAVELGLPVAHEPEAIVGIGASAGIVVAYGRVLRPPVLGSMPLLNLHFSLLPRWRGAAPVERAILAGDERTGVCVMEIESGLDTGPIHGRAETAVGDKSLDELWQELAATGSDLLVDLLGAGLGRPEPQAGVATHAPKLDRSERFVDPVREPAEMCARRVRLGGAWTELRGERLGITKARRIDASSDAPPGAWLGADRVATSDGSVLELVEVQVPGRRPVSAADWARGARRIDGERFGRG